MRLPSQDIDLGANVSPRKRARMLAQLASQSRKERTALTIEAATKEMVTFAVSIPKEEVVFFKSIVEASEGLASVFGEQGGELWLSTSSSQAERLRELVRDLLGGASEHDQ